MSSVQDNVPHNVAEEQKTRGDEAKVSEAKNSEAMEVRAAYITGPKLWLVVASLSLIGFLMLLDMSIIVTAIPSITSDFQSLDDVGWYGTAYLLASCTLQPSAGKLYTQFSLKYTFICFVLLFETGSVICGAATTSTMLIVGRAVAGMGGSGITNGALTILSAIAPKHRQPVLIGVSMGLGQVAIACGPLLGGLFTQHVSWRWCFYINLPMGAVAALLLLVIRIPNRLPSAQTSANYGQSRHATKLILSNLDIGGLVFFAAFIVMVSLALEWGGSTYAWRSTIIICLFCGGGLALVAFIAWESFIGDAVAMIPLSVASKRKVWCSCFNLALFSAAMFTFSYYLPIYFQAVKGVSPTLSGVYMLPGILTQIIMSMVSGIIIGKTGYYTPWALASGIIGAVAAGLLSTLQPDSSVAKWVMYQFIGGFGRGCGMQIPFIAIQNALPPEKSALGVSLAAFGQTFGGSLFLNFSHIIFRSGLVAGLQSIATSVNIQAVIAAGATAFKEVVPAKAVPGVLGAYALGVDRTFYLAAGASAATILFALGMGWRKTEGKSGSQKH
ncbi:hypothetical protein HIM_08274 [Hirsutella minnesotensis 3608]|uniref:Major facilitator superfamily (MFS) profile domain-containing protein n=1 Tax=Hirsutella minnesotensis 3608 TaxID=1043627 RepID=A0A0F7ZT20_9HYPO|nr:hypothetical protein HIM_08274 [Hirsutella minnesotensis 3608]